MPPPPADADRFVAGLVLGAGGSKRLGRPKQLLPYGDGTLLGHVVRVARDCSFDQTIVAIGGAADEVRENVDLAGAEVVVNEDFGAGCSSTIAAALAAVDPRCEVLVLMLGDQPGVGAETVAKLLAGRGDAPLAVCRYDEGKGHPIAFSREVFPALAELHGDKGVWRLLDQRAGEVAEVPIEGPIPRDVDTPEDYRAVLAEAGGETGDAPAAEKMGEAAAEIERIVPDVETLARRLAAVDYLVDEGLATSIFLSLRLSQPLLLEGEAGVGKTEAALSLAAVLDTPLIRLQCYEGIDAAEALYEWNYPRQLLSIRLADSGGRSLDEEELFGPDYLIRRPLLRALEHPGPRPAVLLIDEIDRADDDFEAFLLELLADASVTIPELGTIRATHPPIIVLTSNRTRDLHDAVKRRCLYRWIDYPSPEREIEIVRRRVKGASETLAVQVADAVSRMRQSDVQKPPGIAEAIDWLAALSVLGIESLDVEAVDLTLGSVLKYDEDQEVIRAAGLEQLVPDPG
jgi:MoxR-like ATPase/CTP:molybdopterin cytidylyltransferase MocA